MNYREYEIWHDESKEGGYHHGILLIPIDKKFEILNFLKKIRDEYGFSHSQKIKFAGSLKKSINRRCISNQLSLFSHIIKSQKIKDDNLITRLCNPTEKNRYTKEYSHFLEISGLFDCRFGLLKIEDNFKALHFNNYAKKVEKTFNFILKACCHGMFSKNNPIEITKFYFDGDEHHGGKIDLSNIINGNFRDYIKIDNYIDIDSRHRDERNDETAIIIDFVDVIVGAWRHKLNNESDKMDILKPISEIYDRLVNNMIFLNKNSKWYKSISLSEFKIKDDQICFPDIFNNPNQEKLF